jgi:hypothetical protein
MESTYKLEQDKEVDKLVEHYQMRQKFMATFINPENKIYKGND